MPQGDAVELGVPGGTTRSIYAVVLDAPALNPAAAGLAPLVGGLAGPANFMIPFRSCHNLIPSVHSQIPIQPSTAF